MRMLTVTQALVWKEVREMWTWAAGVMLLVAAELAYVYGASVLMRGPVGYIYFLMPLMWVIVPVTPLLCGAVLGFHQFHAETQRDLWAFLVHRPVSRGGSSGQRRPLALHCIWRRWDCRRW